MSSAEEDYNFVFKGEEETSPPCLHSEDGVGGGRGCTPRLVFPKLGWGWGLPLCPSSKPSVLQRGFGTGGWRWGRGAASLPVEVLGTLCHPGARGKWRG